MSEEKEYRIGCPQCHNYVGSCPYCHTKRPPISAFAKPPEPRPTPKPKTATAVTSREQTPEHDTFCSVCRVWYPRAKGQCPNCGRGLLNG